MFFSQIPNGLLVCFAMTRLLQTLHEHGILYVSLAKPEEERRGNPHESLNAYYETMGVVERQCNFGIFPLCDPDGNATGAKCEGAYNFHLVGSE